MRLSLLSLDDHFVTIYELGLFLQIRMFCYVLFYIKAFFPLQMGDDNLFCFIVIENMRAVGMHHHGGTTLTINGRYSCIWEPECVYDLGNAMAVKDHRRIVRAYLARSDAYVVSSLCYANIIHGVILCRPTNDPHVVLQQLGPQIECRLKFKTKSKDLPLVKEFLDNANFVYTIVNY